MSDNLFEIFRSCFPKDTSQPFIETNDGHVHTYADLVRITTQYHNYLCSSGVKREDRVAVQVEKSPEAIFLYLACLRAGATFLPINTAYTAEEIRFLLSDAEPTMVVCDPTQEKNISQITQRHDRCFVKTLDALGSGTLNEESQCVSIDTRSADVHGSDTAAILYSSGTTGRPKGVMLSHRNLARNAEALHDAWQFGPDDVLLHALPIFHTHGLFVAINTVLMNGTGMLFHPAFDPHDVITDFARATVFMGVPTYYTRILAEQELTAAACKSMRLFISGSAPLLEQEFNAFRERTGHSIVERYGMTEAGIITSADPQKKRRPGTVGWPLPNVDLRITDKSGKVVVPGITGAIQIKSPGLFSGYWRMPEKMSSEFSVDGYFQTGDLGKIEPDGMLTIMGRETDMFISGGYNIYPKEIEVCVDAIDGIIESAVVGMPHPDFGEAGLAIIVVALDSTNHKIKIIRRLLKDKLADYKVPKLFLITDALPRNAMGKVQKKRLRKTYLSRWTEYLEIV